MQKAHRLIAITAVSMFGTGMAGMAAAQALPPSTGSEETTTEGAASGEMFTKLDSDQDGMISTGEAEANTDLAARWKELDANQDDQLDQAEFAQFEISAEGSAEGSSEDQ